MWQHGVNDEDLSRYSKNIESVGLRKCLRACPTSWRENSWYRYGMSLSPHGYL